VGASPCQINPHHAPKEGGLPDQRTTTPHPQPEAGTAHNRARDLNRERVAIYCRISSDEQAQAGTIQNQVEFARRYCDLHQLPIAEIYADEGVSGTVPLAERPEGARLLADAKAGKFGAALVYRIDRLARSTRVLLDAHDALKASGVALRSMTEPFDTSSPLGEFIMTLLGSLAALERATILERMSLGKHRAAREGRWLGGAPPFGYRVEGPEHDRRLVVHPEEAAVARRMPGRPEARDHSRLLAARQGKATCGMKRRTENGERREHDGTQAPHDRGH
jgi:DNA invertase Pin-like site-specific DNA recombinase